MRYRDVESVPKIVRDYEYLKHLRKQKAKRMTDPTHSPAEIIEKALNEAGRCIVSESDIRTAIAAIRSGKGLAAIMILEDMLNPKEAGS